MSDKRRNEIYHLTYQQHIAAFVLGQPPSSFEYDGEDKNLFCTSSIKISL
jgi:hypothetical protein